MMHTAAVGASAQQAADSQLGSRAADVQSSLRAVTESTGSSVVLRVGGDIDVSNERTWQRLLSQSAARGRNAGFVRNRRSRPRFHGVARLCHPGARGGRMPQSWRQPAAGGQPADRGAHHRCCGLRPLLPTYTTVETALCRRLSITADQSHYVARATPGQGYPVTAVAVVVDAARPPRAARPALAPMDDRDAAR